MGIGYEHNLPLNKYLLVKHFEKNCSFFYFYCIETIENNNKNIYVNILKSKF